MDLDLALFYVLLRWKNLKFYFLIGQTCFHLCSQVIGIDLDHPCLTFYAFYDQVISRDSCCSLETCVFHFLAFSVGSGVHRDQTDLSSCLLSLGILSALTLIYQFYFLVLDLVNYQQISSFFFLFLSVILTALCCHQC